MHINKRIKARPLVQLPVEALLLQYQDPTASSFVTVSFLTIFLTVSDTVGFKTCHTIDNSVK